MLSLQMKSGDYVTIGENVVVQVFRDSGPQFSVSIKAPREIPIVRGAVLERTGQERPDGLYNRGPRKSPSEQIRSARKLEEIAKKKEGWQKEAEVRSDAMAEMDRILSNMDQNSAEIRYLRFQLERMVQASNFNKVSTGLQAG